MSLRNSTPKTVPHTEREVMLGCIDGRLVFTHLWQSMHFKRTDFLIRMAGGGAALITNRDSVCCMGQITDAHTVRPVDKVIIQIHMDCTKIRLLCKKGGELAGKFDPDDPESMYELGDLVAKLVIAEFRRMFHFTIEVSVSVVRIIPGKFGLPAIETVPDTRVPLRHR